MVAVPEGDTEIEPLSAETIEQTREALDNERP